MWNFHNTVKSQCCLCFFVMWKYSLIALSWVMSFISLSVVDGLKEVFDCCVELVFSGELAVAGEEEAWLLWFASVEEAVLEFVAEIGFLV